MDSINPALLMTTPWLFSANLYQRLLQEPQAPYASCEVTTNDLESSFINRLFEASKPKNYFIATARCVYNPALSNQFQSGIVTQEQESQSSVFAPKWSQEQPVGPRGKAMQKFEEICTPYNPFFIKKPNQRKDVYSATKVMPLWHGTQGHICESICKTGFSTFGKHEIIHETGAMTSNTDIGYFGSGLYFTTSAEYASKIYSDGNLLLAWVSMRGPYPVVADRVCFPPDEPSDMKKLKGLGAYQNYNAHYIRVISTKPSDPNCQIYYPCAENQTPAWDEVVVFQKSQTLPWAWITIQPNFLTSPTLPTQEERCKEANDYAAGKGGKPKDLVKAFELYTELAEEGYAEAQYSLGNCYLTSDGVEEDMGKGISWVKKAALQDHLLAHSVLGLWYLSGCKKMKADEAQGNFWHERKRALQGDAGAQYRLGSYYANGLGVGKNIDQAVSWYEKAAKQENAEAQCALAFLYAKEGEGVKKDIGQSVSWFTKAAANGNLAAQVNMGNFYENGLGGVTKHMETAYYWYLKAANRDNAVAQFKVGYFYEIGLGGLQKDFQSAISWYQKAVAQGNLLAKGRLGELNIIS